MADHPTLKDELHYVGVSPHGRKKDSPTRNQYPRSRSAASRNPVVQKYHKFIHTPNLRDVQAYNKKIDLTSRKLRSLTDLGAHPTVEYFYLGQNLLKSLDGFQVYENLKILDVGANRIESLAGLSACPQLKHFFASENKITTLKGMPTLPSLEILSLNGNSLTTLEGMPPLPSLQILYLSRNDLQDLRHLNRAFGLSEIDLSKNPICESLSHRMAVLLSCGPNVQTISNDPVEASEIEMAETISPVVAEAIREGMPATPENISETAVASYFDDLNRASCSSAGVATDNEGCLVLPDVTLTYLGAQVADTPVAGAPITLNIEVAISPEDAPVSWEYQWCRINQWDVEPVDGADMRDYIPTSLDIGCVLRCDYLIIMNNQIAAQGICVTPIVQAPPVLESLEVSGVLEVGQKLTASAAVILPEDDGSHDLGEHAYEWFVVDDDGEPVAPGSKSSQSYYTVTTDDIGYRIMCRCTPRRDDGVEGSWLAFTTSEAVVDIYPVRHGSNDDDDDDDTDGVDLDSREADQEYSELPSSLDVSGYENDDHSSGPSHSGFSNSDSTSSSTGPGNSSYDFYENLALPPLPGEGGNEPTPAAEAETGDTDNQDGESFADQQARQGTAGDGGFEGQGGHRNEDEASPLSSSSSSAGAGPGPVSTIILPGGEVFTDDNIYELSASRDEPGPPSRTPSEQGDIDHARAHSASLSDQYIDQSDYSRLVAPALSTPASIRLNGSARSLPRGSVDSFHMPSTDDEVDLVSDSFSEAVRMYPSTATIEDSYDNHPSPARPFGAQARASFKQYHVDDEAPTAHVEFKKPMAPQESTQIPLVPTYTPSRARAFDPHHPRTSQSPG